MLDPKTLIAMVNLLAVILALCMFGLHKTLPDSIRGLRSWALALLSFAAASGLVFAVQRTLLRADWLPLGGALYVAGAMALAISIRRYTGHATRWRRAVGLYALAITPAPLSLVVDLPHGWPQLWLMLVMMSCSLTALHALIQSSQVRGTLGGWLLLFGFSALFCTTVLRLYWLFDGTAQRPWLDTQHSVQAQAILMFASAALLIGSIGLMFLATDRLRRMLEHLASHDALTGLLERNGFRGPAEHSLALAQRRGEPVACLLCDIDHFKRVNDEFGHPAGDAVLVKVAATLSDAVRASDLVARFGGEEFALLLPNCDAAAAGRFAERLRSQIEATEFKAADRSVRVTISIGIAVGRVNALHLEGLYKLADRALYSAKRGGRNRVCLSAPDRQNIAPNTQEASNYSTPSP